MLESEKPFRVGIIGTGRISDIYFQTLNQYPQVEIAVCGSLNLDESRAKAKEHKISRVAEPEAIIADPELDCILNLTIPAAHASVSMAALEAGKHIYSEKPLVSTLADAQPLFDLAKRKGLTIGNAPDTFLGGRWQTVRKLLDANTIGRPTGCTAFVGTHGTERHVANPDFYYQPGGGPMLDLGPYYLSAMVFCMGAIIRVAGMSNRAFDKRQIEYGSRTGEWIEVDTDTHVQGMVQFASGAIGSITMSFDIWDSETPRFEIYGTEGTICIPDPDPVHGANIFQGEVLYRTRETSRWTHKPRPTGREHWQVATNSHGLNQDSRGIGLIEMADAIAKKRKPRCSGELAYHILEVMMGILDNSGGQFTEIVSRPPIPELLPERFPES